MKVTTKRIQMVKNVWLWGMGKEWRLLSFFNRSYCIILFYIIVQVCVVYKFNFYSGKNTPFSQNLRAVKWDYSDYIADYTLKFEENKHDLIA